ncbi:hypothetical protein GOBAR_DD00022 [Gossypium barbadense]|nr:hypothetical protein GOBAR_DD00022 [Gossypium barbadense]
MDWNKFINESRRSFSCNCLLKLPLLKIVDTLLGNLVKRFNVNAIIWLDVDIRLLEPFADNLAPLFSEEDVNQLKNTLVESRQLINLLLSSHPENFLNPVIRESSYNTLDYRKVMTILEKLRDPSDRLFGIFGSRGAKQNSKKKSLDALIKTLRCELIWPGGGVCMSMFFCLLPLLIAITDISSILLVHLLHRYQMVVCLFTWLY